MHPVRTLAVLARERFCPLCLFGIARNSEYISGETYLAVH